MDFASRLEWVAGQVDRVLSETFGDEFPALGPDDPLEASGLDSVDMLDAVAAVEKHFHIALDRDELVGIGTLRALCAVVHDRLVEVRGEEFEPG